MSAKKPLVLLILDGWGHNDAPEHNAIHAAHSPVWDRLWAQQPRALISGSGLDVGLPDGQMGNSEVGHMTLGSGRIVWQSLTRIDRALATGEFADNPVYLDAIDRAVAAGGAVHIMGLLSPGGVHSHSNHIEGMLRLAHERGATQIYLHAFLDGRDTPPKSAMAAIDSCEALFQELGVGRFASISGRYYAMDRDNRWDRVEPVYRLIQEGDADHSFDSAVNALESAYQAGQTDEFVLPSRVGDPAPLAGDDALIFMNFRADRARQLMRVFADEEFDEFPRAKGRHANLVMTTEYAANIDAPVAFPPTDLVNSFGEVMARSNKTQLRIAETEKYAHVTFFFSGGREDLYEGEERVLVPSPQVATYDLKPEMSAHEVTDKLCDCIQSGQYDSIICNYANGDMVGHTGVFDAAVKAVETLDECLGRVIDAVEKAGGQCLITADHGNVERMVDVNTGDVLTAHTSEPVPLVYVGRQPLQLLDSGTLADVAPTMLALMGLEQPEEMSGRSLVALDAGQP